jgi:hypothetical protein
MTDDPLRDALNHARGRASRVLVPVEPKAVGDLGVGRGGAATPRQPDNSMGLSAQIRHAALVVRGRISIEDVIANS